MPDLHRRTQSLGRLVGVLLLVAMTGCGSDNPRNRQAISGRVTLDGVPLDQGTIGFSPESQDGIGSGTRIHDGVYSIATAKGLPPGKYIVRINSIMPDPRNGKGVSSIPGGVNAGLPGVERIAPAFNAQSSMTIEVVSRQKSEFNFDTKSK